MLAGCLVSLLAIAILAAAIRSSSRTAQETRIESSTADTGSYDSYPAEEIFDFSNLDSDRPDYRFSVIPRGAYTEAELRTAIQNDPVVAAHYRQVDQSKLRTEVVARDRYVHVSYRKGNEIFWTKNKVLLRQGETIVTDGTTQVRARCGNCISEEALLPTAENEPDAVEFDRLVDAVPTPFVPQVALVQPVAPSAANRGLAAPEIAAPGSTAGGAPTPLASSRLGAAGAPTPLAASERATPAGGSTSPTPTPTPTPSPFPNPGPGPDVVPPWFVDVPGLPPLDPLDPLVPLDELFPNPPNGPPVYDVPPPGSPGDPANPTPVPEPGTIILVGGGVAELIRRKMRSRKR